MGLKKVMINYPFGWFDIKQLPKKLEEKMVDVFIADGSINGLTNYALFTVPISLDIKEKYGVIHTAQRMKEDGWTMKNLKKY